MIRANGAEAMLSLDVELLELIAAATVKKIITGHTKTKTLSRLACVCKSLSSSCKPKLDHLLRSELKAARQQVRDLQQLYRDYHKAVEASMNSLHELTAAQLTLHPDTQATQTVDLDDAPLAVPGQDSSE